MNNKTVGKRITRLRTDAGLSQTECALGANISVIHLQRLERGHATARWSDLEGIAKSCGATEVRMSFVVPLKES